MKDNVNKLKFTTNGTNRHEQQGNNMTRVRGVCLVRGLFSLLCATAIFFTACEFNFDSRPESGTAEFVPVENIIGIPTGSFPYVTIHLTGTVLPENATYKKAEWTIKNDAGVHTTLDENRLTVESENDVTVTVTAVIINGLGEGEDYTQDFNIAISPTELYPVKNISDIPTNLPIGDYMLNGRITPYNAANTHITWSVIETGGTGAAIVNNHVLRTSSEGMVKIRATIAWGKLDSDYTQDFSIRITKPVYVAGYWADSWQSSAPLRACYWINEIKHDLVVPQGMTNSLTTGIVYVDGKQYIAGYYNSNAGIYSPNYPYTACYWVVDEENPEGVLTALTSAGTGTRTYAIATNGTDIYITGKDAGTRCYWKIDSNGTVTRQNLTVPTGETMDYLETQGLFNGRFVVKNSQVYIPFQTGTDINYFHKSYYWDETGNYNAINAFNKDVRGISHIDSIAVMNGRVYMGGWSSDTTSAFYWIMGTDDYISLDKGRYGGTVESIIALNGEPRFYSDYSGAGFYWDALGNQTVLPHAYSAYDTGLVFSFDGDVYIVMDEGYMVFGTGYTATGSQYRLFDSYREPPTYGKITGITVPGGNDQPVIVPVTGVHLNKSSLTLFPGTEETLIATVVPSNATDKFVTWASGNPGVATVNQIGKVTAVGPGTTAITVTTVDGGFKAVCTVTVNNLSPLSGTITITPAGPVLTGVELTANYTGPEVVSYQWKWNGTDIGSDSKYMYPGNAYAGEYTVTVSAPGHTPKTSAPVTVIQAHVYDFSYLSYTDSYMIDAYSGPGGDLTIPHTYLGKPVTEIGTAAFSSDTNITSVLIPASITFIGYSAFANCDFLATVYFDAGSQLIEIGNGAFNGCQSLTRITIPASVTTIGFMVFHGCPALTEVTFMSTGITLASNNGTSFWGDLRAKYVSGGAGRYTTTSPASASSTWTKQ